MPGFEKYASVKNQQKNLDVRLSELEEKETELSQRVLPALFQTMQRMSNQFGKEQGEHEEAIQALIELVGEQKVAEVVLKNRKLAQEQAVAGELAAYEQMLQAGALIKVDTVTNNSVVVGTEYKEDGTALEPLRVPVVMQKINNPEVKAALLGKGVGDKVALGTNNRTFQVLEVYVENPVPPQENTSTKEEFGVQPVEQAQSDDLAPEATNG